MSLQIVSEESVSWDNFGRWPAELVRLFKGVCGRKVWEIL